MWFNLLRPALISPMSTVLDGFRFWWRHGACLRQAGRLCHFGDGLRLRRVRGWEVRSGRVYRRAARTLRELAPAESNAEANWARQAHQSMTAAREPIRRLYAAVLMMTTALALVAATALAVVCAVSPNVRSRLFPRDLAEGKPWYASSTAFNVAGSGFGPSSEEKLFFHTAFIADPFVEIDLGEEHILRGLRIENREDCCKERALPLDVKVLQGDTWTLVAERRAYFTTWTYDIEPVRAQKIRFCRPGTDFFHLKRISIYGQ